MMKRDSLWLHVIYVHNKVYTDIESLLFFFPSILQFVPKNCLLNDIFPFTYWRKCSITKAVRRCEERMCLFNMISKWGDFLS